MNMNMNKKVYVLAGTYFTIEDSRDENLWCFENKEDAQYYMERMTKFMQDCEAGFYSYKMKHFPKDVEDGFNEYELNHYIVKVSKLLLRNDNVVNFWAKAFEGLDYSDYLPIFKVKEIDVITRRFK